MLARLVAPAVVTLGLGFAPTAQAAWMMTGWEDFRGTQQECLDKAATALRGLNFSVTLSPQTAFGWRGQDGVSVRCINERRMAAIFVHTVTSAEDARGILDRVGSAYRAAAPGASPAPGAAPGAAPRAAPGAAPATPPGSGGSKF